MPLSPETITQIAQNFLKTEAEHAPLEPVANFYTGITPAEAYRLQQAVVSGLSNQGHTIIGKKAGATNSGSQASLGVDEAVYGILFDIHQAPYGQAIAGDVFIKGALECEIAFKMKQPLTGPNITADDVLAATETIVPAFELVDFRVTDFKPGMAEAIGYNVFARRFMLGQHPVTINGRDLSALKVTLNKNGQKVAAGTGEDVLGHPLDSVAWLANKLAENGGSIDAGDIILTGSMTPPHPLAAGDKFEAVFEGLETISVQFS